MNKGAEQPADGGVLVILLKDDTAQRKLLLELFTTEGMDVLVCATLPQVYTALERHPEAVVVADSWATGDQSDLGQQQRSEIEELGRRARLIVATGREWGRQVVPGELGTVAVVPKPYDLDDLLDRVRIAQQGVAAV